MSEHFTRRTFLVGAGLSAGSVLLATPLHAAAFPTFAMWHSPGCGCCLEWAKRIEASFKRKLPIIETANIASVKLARGVPDDLRSCHTAVIDGYVVEGHVPPRDIQRLVASRSKAIRGLAVAGMPAGSPGMDVGHHRRDPYKVIAFAPRDRRSVFATYG